MPASSDQFKVAMSRFASGVTVVTTLYHETKIGLTASSFTSVSLDPLLILVAIGKHAFTHKVIQESGKFAVNILGAHQAELGMRFAGLLPHVEDRFAGLDLRTSITGCPILPDVPVWLDCEVWNVYDGGDHSIFVGQVLDIGLDENTPSPLVYCNRTWGRMEPLKMVP